MPIGCFIATREEIEKSTKRIRATESKDPFNRSDIDPLEGLISVDVSKMEIPQWQLEAFMRAGEHNW